jgi:hypothetical protein
MNNGRGGFDFATTINLDTKSILKNIWAVLHTNDASNITPMQDAGSEQQGARPQWYFW